MAVVKAFRGWRYNSDKIKNLKEVVVPPYDVISPHELAQMKKANQYNFSNVILSEGLQKHQRAAELFSQWQREKVFIQEQKPALYFYKQTFKLDFYELFGQNVMLPSNLSRVGMFAAIGLEDYEAQVIFPHEKTFSGPKADRYQLMEATHGNMEPVFLGYDSDRFTGDEFEKAVARTKPLYHFEDDACVIHTLWAVEDPAILKEVAEVLAYKPFYILDGHHRYETALKYYKDHRSTGEFPESRYVLAQICSLKQPGAVILPTHRLVKGIEKFNSVQFAESLSREFEWTETESLSRLEDLMSQSPTACYGVLLHGGARYRFLKLRDSVAAKYEGKLDLEILHEVILPVLTGAEKATSDQSHGHSHKAVGPEIAYVKSIPEAQSRIRGGEFQIGFLVRPTTAQEVMNVASHFKKMPHKSTFFYPKIPSGLVVHQF